ncbi:outer membrane lipoprotein LolB|uniref:Outer-membrane lipoprotein LolB n=1 Tax=Brenneria salicis ATCC 15712 = DSM 30166 TaxID=714314 RepID=A0A366I8V8_9GAMM|nr:lipoprotein insertase outer membrane protein LolB [Brenneria salicis]NMN91713.1 outer membrane lipoprotein LolB [Brenneria salicis ATCC 15712 = DSM 30166]RBP65771.1 outer membrane lipoprotein LolB [Brenneria salicis ATCC 15712 = DSM 30166]RLM31812.1 lipoprotein localization factor LolB [Brenneria salicis ATCC 15712 = DSM 30166]
MPINTVRCLRLLPLASLLLTACSLNQPTGPGKSQTSPEWQQHQQQVRQLSQYQARGSFAYISDRKRVSANFFWQDTPPQRYRLLLTNPLGSTELDLRTQPDGVQITDNQGQRYEGRDAEAMIQQLTGMAIPLNNLRQWIIGLPGDASEFTLDDRSLLKTITYRQGNQSWNVDYQRYNTEVNPPMPVSLELVQDEQRIKLKMNNWIVK